VHRKYFWPEVGEVPDRGTKIQSPAKKTFIWGPAARTKSSSPTHPGKASPTMFLVSSFIFQGPKKLSRSTRKNKIFYLQLCRILMRKGKVFRN
jgi:hypothetical protein